MRAFGNLYHTACAMKTLGSILDGMYKRSSVRGITRSGVEKHDVVLFECIQSPNHQRTY